MSEYVNQPQPGASSDEGAYSRQPQQPTYYFKDNNQYGTAYAVTSPQAPAQAGTGTPAAADTGVTSWINFSSGDYLKGVAVGAGVVLVATNPTVQKAVVSGAVKLWAALQGGVEELKEQVQDAKAELSQED